MEVDQKQENMSVMAMDIDPEPWESTDHVLSPQRLHFEETSPLSAKATELKAAAACGNWSLVHNLLSSSSITKCEIEQSCLFHTLAAAPEVSLPFAQDILTKILIHKIDINMVDKNKDTAIVLAARCDNTKMVIELLSRQAALPQDETHVCSFLQTLTKTWKQEEARYMHVLVVKLLWDRLKDRVLYSCQKLLHETLVQLAVTFHVSLVREMFLTKLQLNTLDSEGMAVLHRLAMFDSDNHVRLVHFLINKGANIHLQNTTGDTALHVAAKQNNWMMMGALLRRQATTDVADCDQRSVLHILASHTDPECFSKIDQILTLLICNNNDLNKKDGHGNTALHLAALAGNITFMKKLLDGGACADCVNDEQKTVLHMIAMTKSKIFSTFDSCMSILMLILKRGADVDKVDSEGNSAVHIAAKHENWVLVEFLLKYVDNTTQPDSEGFNILHRFAMKPFARMNILFYKLSQKVADINARSWTGDTAIDLAVKGQNWGLVKLLVEGGAAWYEIDDEGYDVLKQFAMAENTQDFCFPFFLEKSINYNTQSLVGDTALHLTARYGKRSQAERIVKHVENIDEVDSEGLTVIQRLVMKATNVSSRHYFLIHHLLERGADYTRCDPNGDTVLHLATRNGHWKVVKCLVELGVRTDTLDSEGFSILHRVAVAGKDSYSQNMNIEKLLQSGACMKQKDLQGNTPLHLAVQHQNWAVAKELVQCGAEVNELDLEGYTILQRLAQMKDACLSLAQLLLEKGARCDIVSYQGDTICDIIADSENWNMMECLLKHGMPAFKEYENKYLLHCLASSSHGDMHTDVCDLLIEKGWSVDAEDHDGNTPLHLTAKAGNWKLMEHLIQKGASGRTLDSSGISILHRFVTDVTRDVLGDEEYQATLNLILSSGVKVNATDPQGNTALQIAAKRRLIYIVDCLIDKAENPNAKDSDGFTLLLRLSQMPSKSCFSHCYDLQKKGVDINTCTTNGESALHLAVKSNNWPMVHFLLNRGAQLNVQDLEQMYTIHRLIKCSTSAYCGSDELRLMTLLTDMGLSIAMPDSCGRTPAELAFKHKKWKLLKYLLELGAQLNPTPSKGSSLFHELAKLDFIKKEAAEVTHLIVNHVSGINLKNNVGDTPVHVALNEDNWDVVKAFVEHGADPNILDRKGQCLLHKFVTNLNQKNSVRLVKALVKHGAEINWRGPNGKTALQLAASNSEWEMVVALIELGADCILTPKEKLSALRNLHCLTWRDEKKLKLFINCITNNVSGSDINTKLKKEFRGYENPLLQKCVETCNWMMAKALVECGAEVSLILENKALLQLIMSRPLTQAWTPFFDLLISKGLDINTRLENQSPVLFSKEVIRSLIHEKDVSRCLFCAWLKRGANPLIVNCRGQTLLRKVTDFNRRGTLNALIKLLPTGVTTHQPKITEAILQSERSLCNYNVSPTENAIQDYNICALKMLIGSGASSNAELFRLNTEYQMILADEVDANEEVRELLEVLDQAASQPRSLTSLCRLTVSHLLGCGPCRPDKIKRLEIPSLLKSLISFSDLVSTEFLSQKHEDVHSGLSEDSNDFSSNSDYNDSGDEIDGIIII